MSREEDTVRRKRFTAPEALLQQAEEYARLDHRSFSELVCETLRQHMKRYPKKGVIDFGNEIVARIERLEKMVGSG